MIYLRFESMKIAMISYHTCPLATLEGGEIGGANTYILELSKELSRQGHQVDIYTRTQRTSDPPVVKIRQNLRLIHLKAGPRRNVLKRHLVKYFDEFVKNYQSFTQKEKLEYDLFHCHYYMSGLIGLLLKKNGGRKPMVLSFHTLALMKNLVARGEQEKEGNKRIDAEYLLTKSADAIIAPSLSDATYLKALYDVDPKKINVIPPGVNLKLFRPLNKISSRLLTGARGNKIVLFVGRIEPLKGLDMLLYSVKLLLMRRPDLKFCLWIVGGNVNKNPKLWSHHLKTILQLRQTLGLNTIVKFVGQKPQSKLPYYYNSAEIVVMPSHYESFGMVALEAMACGRPILTSNATGISEILDKKFQNLTTSVNNPLLLSYQMEKVLEDKNLRSELKTEGLRKSAPLSWQLITQKVINVYQKLL